MIHVYVKLGTDFNDVLAISSINSNETSMDVLLENSTVDLSKLEGYMVYTGEDSQNYLKFSEEQYSKYLEEKAAQEKENEKQQQLEDMKKELLDMITVTYEKSDKKGYKYKKYKVGDVVVKTDYVEDTDSTEEEVNDGSDYTKPITYKEGMSVTKGLWYTDGDNIWECILDGMPTSFSDKEYFDIVE